MRLDQLARHHPLRAFFRQHRIRCDEKFDAARSQVFIALHALHADVAKQPAQQGFVDLFVGRRLFVRVPGHKFFVFAHAHLGDLSVQLLVQLAPLAQPQWRQEILAAFFRQQAIGFFIRHRLFEPCPYLQVGEKIGTLIGKAFMRRIRGFLPVQRTFARVLHRQRAGDDQDLGQAMVLPPRQQQARDLRVQRQLGEFVAQPGELPRFVDRAEFGEQLIAVRDHPRGGRLDEWKL